MKEDQASMSIFISCAKKDERLLKELENHLSVLKEQRVITTWHYGQIIGGTNRNEVINKQLDVFLTIERRLRHGTIGIWRGMM